MGEFMAPSGNLLQKTMENDYFFMGETTISMAIFNSKLLVNPCESTISTGPWLQVSKLYCKKLPEGNTLPWLCHDFAMTLPCPIYTDLYMT